MECEPWQGPEKSQRKRARPSPWDWVMASSVVKDSRMHFSLITPISSILGPHQPLKAQLCSFGILGLFLPIVCSSLWCYPQYRTKETPLYVMDHLQFHLGFQMKKNIMCFSSCRGEVHFAPAMQMEQRFTGESCLISVLYLLDGRQTGPQNWIPKRELENLTIKGLQRRWELVTGL